MSDKKKRACIVGAGLSGLPSIKACLEVDLEPVCYEKTNDLGGLWNYRDLGENISTVMSNTIVNTSKEMMSFSDYPPPKEYPNFMHNSLVNEYLHNYAKHFDLNPYIKLNTALLSISPADGHESNGQWIVTTSEGETTIFDYVFICTGHHSYPSIPKFEGLDDFQGTVMHTQQLHSIDGLCQKDVLVIGIGNSAMDAATSFAPVSKSVTMSTRRGTWVWGRIGLWGIPYDIYFLTRFNKYLRTYLPRKIVNIYLERILNRKMDHDMYGIRPNHRFDEAHPTLNDALPNLLCSGQIVIKGDVRRFTSDSVVFDDGVEKKVDLVILGTGYHFGYPFLKPQSLIPIENNNLDAYKYVFPTKLQKQTLAIIGLIQPIGSISPVSEMQARWAAAVFSGRVTLPSIDEQQADVELKRSTMKKRYVATPRHTIQIEYQNYMDEIAPFIGCDVSLIAEFRRTWSMKWLFQLFFGPYYPYLFRLHGPHAWSGAEEAVKTARSRVWAPLQNRPLPSIKSKADKPLTQIALKAFLHFMIYWSVGVLFGLLYLTAMKIGIDSPFLFLYLSGCTILAIGTIMFLIAYFFEIAVLI